jgi:nucleotide-binding universal stress UspA family protein
MQRFQHLTVALATTEADAGLIRYAAMIARLGTAAEVRFVHVLPGASHAGAVRDHEQILEQMQAAVRGHFLEVPAGTSVTCDVVTGALEDELLTYAAEHGTHLLFVGHKTEYSGRRALARRLAMKAPCSVWMVPDGSPPKLERPLVPIDFSEPAADAFGVATSLAKLAHAHECLALHVYFNDARVTYDEYTQILRGEEQTAMQRFVAPINRHGVRVRTLLEESANVAHAIERVAAKQEVDLLVMATRGRSRSAAILLGSVTEETIIQTRIPLLVVKHYGAQISVLQALLDRRILLKRGPQTD